MVRLLSILAILISLGVASTALYIQHSGQAGICSDCNIIFVSLSYLGADHTTVYNPNVETTPFLAQLASKSTVFENAYAPSSWALPSLAALLTGQYPWAIHVWKPIDGLLNTKRTLASVLKEHGYATGAYVDGRFLTRDRKFDIGFDTFVDRAAVDYPADDTSMVFSLATACIKKHAGDNTPFFLFISPNSKGVASSTDTQVTTEELKAANRREDGPTSTEVTRVKSIYYSQIKKADAELATLFDTLDTLKLSKKTVVVITSDTGHGLGEHGLLGAPGITLYQSDIHVPLIIYIPNKGTGRVLASIETRSIANTILSILAYPTDAEFGGESLLPYIQGTETKNRTVLSKTIFDHSSLFQTTEARYTNTAATVSAIRGKVQAIRRSDGTTELYVLDVDPLEKKNLLEGPGGVPSDVAATARQLFAALTLEVGVGN